MALDERFVVSSDIEQLYRDKDTGLPLANGKLKFYRDIARNEPKPVYQISGAPPNYTYVSMGSVIDLSAIGTVQNQGQDNEIIYWFPYDGTPDDSQGNIDLYYVVCEDSAGTVQFTREGWPNVTAANSPQDQTNQNFENQISNPTFTNTFLNADIDNVFTFTAAVDTVVPIAPDWDLVCTGTGTVTIKVVKLHGSQNVPASPPVSLDITVSSGITGCILSQKFYKNSGLWASTTDNSIYLYGSFVAQNLDAGTSSIKMYYRESTPGYTPILIVNGAFSSPFESVNGTTQIPIPSSSSSDPDGFVEIYLQFGAQTHTQLTAVQLIPSVGLPASIFSEDLNSSNRNESFQGDYYIPRCADKRISSFLTGWDFVLNPWQFGSTFTVDSTPDYKIDQTIIYGHTTTALTASKGTSTRGLTLLSSVAGAFCMTQYLTEEQAYQLVTDKMSVNFFGWQELNLIPSTKVTARIYLFCAPQSASIPILPNKIGTLNANGTYDLSDLTWSEVTRDGLPRPEFQLQQINHYGDINDLKDNGFSGYKFDQSQISDTKHFAIVVTFAYADPTTKITINSISLVAGDLPCRPAAKTADETLAECQYYYEKSYENDVLPGSITDLNMQLNQQNNVQYYSGSSLPSGGISWPINSSIKYKKEKIKIPDLKLYSNVSGTEGQFHFYFYSNNSLAYNSDFARSDFFALNAYKNYYTLFNNNSNHLHDGPGIIGTSITQSYITYHYVADARLGKV